MTPYVAFDDSRGDDRISWSEPLDGPGPPGPPDTGTPVSATVGVTVGTFTSLSVDPGTVTATGGDPDGIGVGSVFKAAGLIPGGVAASAVRGELTDSRFVCKVDGGLDGEPGS